MTGSKLQAFTGLGGKGLVRGQSCTHVKALDPYSPKEFPLDQLWNMTQATHAVLNFIVATF